MQVPIIYIKNQGARLFLVQLQTNISPCKFTMCKFLFCYIKNQCARVFLVDEPKEWSQFEQAQFILKHVKSFYLVSSLIEILLI